MTIRLLLCFLTISLVPLGALTGFIYVSSENAQQQEVTNLLIAIAEMKVDRIERFAAERRGDCKQLALMPTTRQALEAFGKSVGGGADSPEYQAAWKRYLPVWRRYIAGTRYSEVMLLSEAGQVVLAFQGPKANHPYLGQRVSEVPLEGSPIAHVFDRARTLMETEISDFEHQPGQDHASAYIAAPIMDQGKLAGVLMLRLDAQELYEIINDFDGLRQTGELVVARKEGLFARFVAPTRHDKQAAFKRKVRLGSAEAKPIQEAVEGQQGHGVLVDYRQQSALAAWRYLPSLRWGIVVKLDEQEAFSSIRGFRRSVMWMTGLAFVLIVASALWMTHWLRKQIGILQ